MTIDETSINSAVDLMEMRLYTDAEKLLRRMIDTGTVTIKGYLLLGDCLRNQGNTIESIKFYRKAIEYDPVNIAALCNYGVLLRELKEYSQAELQFRKVIGINKTVIAAYANLGLVLMDQNRFSEASEYFGKAIALDPKQKMVYICYLRSLVFSGYSQQTESVLEQFINLFGNSAESLVAIGNIFMDHNDVAAAKRWYIEALRIDPSSADAHYNLGIIMRQWNNLDDAIVCFKNALRFNSVNPFVFVNLGEVYQMMGEYTDAIDCFRSALKLDPACKIADDNILVSMNYDPKFTPEEIIQAHTRWGERESARYRDVSAYNRQYTSQKKIRIGYVSADFCKHPVASFLEPVLKGHNRDLFEIYCYSQSLHDDSRTVRFRQLADKWTDITSMDDRTAISTIRENSIDILVDCTGHMSGNRLGVFAARCAPVQVTGFGYPSTTGLKTMDYFIADSITDPIDLCKHWIEKPIYIDQGFFCYMPPDDAPDIKPLPALKNGFLTFGSLHTTARLNRDVIVLWAELLKAVPSSRLIFFRTTLTPVVITKLTEWFKQIGINIDRVEFRSKIEHGSYLSVYDEIDCSLDTFPWSGHTTACESLWMGVPIITQCGQRHAGRMVTSLMKRISLEQFVAEDRNQFLSIGEKLSQDPTLLQNIRTSMRKRICDSTVCDSCSWVSSYENKLTQILKS